MWTFFRNSFPLPPLVDTGSPGNRIPQRLADTGVTESQTHRKLIVGKVHVLLVGAAPVRIRWSANGALGAGAVDPTRDTVYAAFSAVPFVPEENAHPDGVTVAGSTYVYAEAADGVSAYEVFVHQFQS
jgi:hypothetical protein